MLPPPLDLSPDALFSVRNQAVVITGAVGTIGQWIVEAFARHGARVLISDRPSTSTPNALSALAERLTAGGHMVFSQPADLTNPADLQALVAGALERFSRLDAIVHCGAIAFSHKLEVESEESFDRLFHTNLRSAWLLTKYAVEPMARQGGGSITHLASINGHVPNFPCSLYAGTKGGLVTMVRELAGELGPRNIRVNTVSPGYITEPDRHLRRFSECLDESHAAEFLERFTPLAMQMGCTSQPLPFGGRGADVAAACLYLTSPAARFITGADILIDGGMMVSAIPHYGKHDRPKDPFWSTVHEYLRGLPAEAFKQQPEWLKRRLG